MTEEVHPDWGKLYPYSDHKRGETITYRNEGREERGEILWVAAARMLPSGREMPPHYIIYPERGGFPDSVFFGDVVMSEEPTLEDCPYCLGMHPKGTIERCPLYHRD